MKLGTFLRGGRQVPVLFVNGAAHDLQEALAGAPFLEREGLARHGFSLLDLIAAGDTALDALRTVAMDAELLARSRIADGEGQPLAPMTRPPKNVFCLGRNYAEHIREDNVSRDQKTELPKYPQFFTKPHTAIVGDGADIRYDERVTRRLDYEVELAVVIGRGGRDIQAGDALGHVFGYTIVNDVTARDLQRRHDQWFKGKGLDTSCPMGPWIVTADEILDPHALRIELSVNGEVRQDASTGDMIFRIPETIESLSAGLTLEPGDVIATGTPSGVGYAMEPRQFLADGDVVECRVEGVGVLRNTVRAVS
ncbi:fumarylacetoacetate hydrolase family protein [Ottowia thiooxydans]|uniref:2-keto-4-pentenoate hydratase/2-oxohepta-3-ene-1,7-dioic acid hydratase in catechol pathway n=1 Tax=Ottowia thiooxydans TaxID=219182 RepID=A0ABV2Q8M6_9BURK